MLKALLIKNYQSHRNTQLVFSPAITGIIGKSLSGKTAILRAMNWLINNRPAGFSFHSNFAKSKKTAVMLVLGDNTKITRSGGDLKAYEVLKPKEEVPLLFKKFGRDVPEVVKDKLNLDEVNIQNQFDVPFLITSPPGRIAETINRITNIEKINDWIKVVNSRSRKVRSKTEVLREDIDELQEKLDKYGDLDDIEPKIEKLEKINKRYDNLIFQKAKIEGTYESLQIVRRQLAEAESALKVKSKIKKLEKIEEKITDLMREDDRIADVELKIKNTKLAEREYDKHAKHYMRKVRKAGKCPTCFEPIDDDTLKRIWNEIRLTKRYSRDEQ